VGKGLIDDALTINLSITFGLLFLALFQVLVVAGHLDIEVLPVG